MNFSLPEWERVISRTFRGKKIPGTDNWESIPNQRIELSEPYCVVRLDNPFAPKEWYKAGIVTLYAVDNPEIELSRTNVALGRPTLIQSPRIASKYALEVWFRWWHKQISLQVWQREFVGLSPSEINLVNQITTQVTNTMSNIYSRGNEANLKPTSGKKNLDPNTTTTLIETNDDRAYLTIRVGAEAIILFADKDEQGNGVNIIEELVPGEVYNLPTSDGIYRGDIFALSESQTTVKFTEFSK